MGNSYPICGETLLPPDEVAEQSGRAQLAHLPEEIKAQFDITEKIGEGTTSTVFLAVRKKKPPYYDASHGETEHCTPSSKDSCSPPFGCLACKVVDKVMAGRDVYEREFLLRKSLKEIKILQMLDHPNIIQYSNMLETPRNMYIFMEYLPGGELFGYLYHHGPIPDVPAGRLIHGVISAVAHMHDLGIVHRDIKAENLMLVSTECPEYLRVKIIDFGFSTVLSHVHTTDSFVGSPGYLAPEIRQHRSYSKSVDIWAVGVLIYLVLCCRLPFEIEVTDLSTDRKEIRGRFELSFKESEWHEIDTSSARDLIESMLHVDQARRFSAAECLAHPWLSAARLGDNYKTHVSQGSKSMPVLNSLKDGWTSAYLQTNSMSAMEPVNEVTSDQKEPAEATFFGLPISPED